MRKLEGSIGGVSREPAPLDARRGSVSPQAMLIRPAGGGEEIEYNEWTGTMEVAATAYLAVHPSTSRLAIGLWHNGAAAGVLYSVGFG